MTLEEPEPILPDGPRYSSLPLPPYRYVPGQNPHPRRDPKGHRYGWNDAPHPDWSPAEWRNLPAYLHGIDLYNRAFWWESHETLEALWLAAGRTTTHARFVRGIILIAAAALNRHRGMSNGGRRQAAVGIASFRMALAVSNVYMGLDLPEFIEGAREYFEGAAPTPPPILLRFGE